MYDLDFIKYSNTVFFFFSFSFEENRVLVFIGWVWAFIDNEFLFVEFFGGGEVRGVVII